MKKIFGILIVLAVIVVACGKDKFETKPQLKLISKSASVIPVGGSLQLVFEFTDKEGDVSDTLFFRKQRLNRRRTGTLRDSLKFPVPEFPNQSRGEIIVNLDYTSYLQTANPRIRIPGSNPSRFEPDTILLKFVLKDKAGNKSDTVIVDDIVVRND